VKALTLVVLVACSPMHYTAGVPNLANVEGSIWRSGQISSAEGWDTIAGLAHGRRVHVIKLNFETEGSDRLADGRGWDLVYLPIQPEGDTDLWDEVKGIFSEPDEDLVTKALAELEVCRSHPSTDACLVHCTHGQDRTGYVVGRYRIADDGWTPHRAFAEMIAHDFHGEILGLMTAWWKHTQLKGKL
jgi:hypothetical protein